MNDIQFHRGAISPGDCISEAWGLVTGRFGLYLGAGVIVLILISCIPFVNFFLLGPLLGGFYHLVLRDSRGEPVDFGALFKGFEKFVPLMVVGLIQSVPGIVTTVIQYTVDIARLTGIGPGIGDATFYQGGSDALWAGFSIGLIIVFAVLFIVAIVWNLGLGFAVPLVMERDLSVGDALVTSLKAAAANPGGLIVLAILQGLVMLVGFLALCLGIFVAAPVAYAAFAIAFGQVFPYSGGGPSYYNTPPPPEAYGGTFGQGQ